MTDEKSEMEKEGKNKSQHFCFLSHNILCHSRGVYKIWRHWLSQVPRQLWQTFWLERKKNGPIKAMTRRRLILFYTIYNKSYPTFVLTFEILDAVVPEKSLTTISLCITLQWEMEKKKTGKSRQNKSQSLGFPSHNKHGHSQDVSKIWALWLS